MNRFNKIIGALVAIVAFTACEKHVVEYDTTPIDDATTAQFQLHYMVPTTTGTANNINKVELNGQVLTNETTPLSTYNAVPSGAVGRFFATEAGTVNLKLYRGAVGDLTLVYDRDIELPGGKHNVIIHDFDEPPIIIDNQAPYPTITTEHTGTTAWVKFYNLLYEKPGEPTPLKMQYQFQYVTDNETGAKSEWQNLGSPVAFGEATGWEPIVVNKTVEVSSGYARVDYRIRLIGPDGNDEGSLQLLNTASGEMRDFSDWWTGYVGRVYHHFLAGNRTEAPVASIRQFTAK
ncbi:hypothetical protein [Parapedobacter sp.]